MWTWFIFSLLYFQGFLNSGSRWGDDFHNLLFEPFLKLKQHSVNIKTKISMTCLSREYEIKTKMVQE